VTEINIKMSDIFSNDFYCCSSYPHDRECESLDDRHCTMFLNKSGRPTWLELDHNSGQYLKCDQCKAIYQEAVKGK
jgi:hypothetical protein